MKVTVQADDLADVLDRVEQLPLAEQPHPDTVRRLRRALDRHRKGVLLMNSDQKRGDLLPRRKSCPVCGWGDNRHHPECNYPGSFAYRWGAVSYALREFGRTFRKAVWRA